MDIRLFVSCLASVIIHVVWIIPGLAAWSDGWIPDSPNVVQSVKVSLRPLRPAPNPGRPASLPSSPGPVVPPRPPRPRRPTTPAPMRPPEPPRLSKHSPPPRLESPQYPQHIVRSPASPLRITAAGVKPASSGISLGLPDGRDPGTFNAPVLLKGPERIPLPEVLKQKGGRFVISLKCAVAVDGSSQVTVMDSSGMIALDENLRDSFSNLPWYPGEEHGKPVPVTVRLIIEASWETGDEVIQWKGRIPR